MDMPEFRDDQEMAEWFEAHDPDPADFEIADDVVVSPDLAVTLLAEVYSVIPKRESNAAGSNAAATARGKRDVTLAIG